MAKPAIRIAAPEELEGPPLLAQSRARLRKLAERDVELEHAKPCPSALEVIRARPTSVEALETVCEIYAERPCLGGAASEIISYATLWRRVRATASGLFHEGLAERGSFAGVFGFGSIDWVVADLACLVLASVSVPLQTSLAAHDLRSIVLETGLSTIVCGAEQLRALETVLPECPTVRGIVVMDIGEGDAEAEATLRRSRQVLEATRGSGFSVRTLREIEACGRRRGIVPKVLPSERGEDDPLMSIVYTSGSTGTPKGAMMPESLWRMYWRSTFFGARIADLPFITLNYMPLNHAAGRGQLIHGLVQGGITFFPRKSDMSTLFEDIRRVRPTQMLLVPRVAAMVYQHFQSEVAKRSRRAKSRRDAISYDVMADMKERFLGDRLLLITTGSAPTPPEVTAFLERCFEVPVLDGYGSTEAGPILLENRVDRRYVSDVRLVDVPELGYRTTDTPYPRGELHVKSAWSSPGYYKNAGATKDLFDDEGFMNTGDVVEQRGPDSFVWIDRAKNVLKLAQGEFVATSRLEAELAARSPLIQAIYLHGKSLWSYLLGVVVPDMTAMEASLRRRDVDDETLKELLFAEIRRAAIEERLHGYEIPRDILVERAPFTLQNGLLTESNKPSRGKLAQRYGAELEAMHERIEQNLAEREPAFENGPAQSVQASVRGAMASTLGLGDADLGRAGRSFVELGGDSLSAVGLSALLRERVGVAVPVAFLLDPTKDVAAVARFVDEALQGDSGRATTFERIHGNDATVVRAEDLRVARLFGERELQDARERTATTALPGEVGTAFLTGANGFLGRFLVLELLRRLPAQGRLYALVRAPSDRLAEERLRKAYRGDARLLSELDRLTSDGRLVVLAGDLTKARFGLTDETFDRLAEDVDAIVHNGALVNHALGYRDLFEPNVLGTLEALRLAVRKRVKVLNYVSTVGVIQGLEREGEIREDEDIRALVPERRLEGGYAAGYATSKWASEALLRDAHDELGIPVNVFRPSGIMAHTEYRGQINVPDFFTRLLAGLVYTRSAPRSFYAEGRVGHYDGLPVDSVARTLAALAIDRRTAPSKACTYDVVNPHRNDGVSLDRIVDWVVSRGYPLDRKQDYAEWFASFAVRLAELDEFQRRHSSLPILGQWVHPIGERRSGSIGSERLTERLAKLAALRGEAELAELPHVTEAFIHKYLDDMIARHIIGPPE